MNVVKMAMVVVAIALIPAPAPAVTLTGGGGGPFFGPMVLRSSDTNRTAVMDYGPSGVYLGVGGMGYAEFGSFRIGGLGLGTSSSGDRQNIRSSIGFGGLTLDMLLRPARTFVVPLGLIVGAGGYNVKDMSTTTGGGSVACSGNCGAMDGSNGRTITDSPFFMVGPRVGFATEVLPWLRIEGSGAFVALFRDGGTSYAFLLSVGPTFGKFDMRPPNPACEDDFPGCRDRYNYDAIPRPPPEKFRTAPVPYEEHMQDQGEREE
jgi:hypothetical protein